MRTISALIFLALAGCMKPYTLDLPDVDIEAPPDLPQRLAEFRAGREAWHGDPRNVADHAIRRYLDVPWKADPFRSVAYDVADSPEWGKYVTRGYTYPSGAVARYRVKVRPYKEIWYPTQISRYKVYDEGGHGGGRCPCH